jgi:putative Mg2+ transporter-C (MgtC) family protein
VSLFSTGTFQAGHSSFTDVLITDRIVLDPSRVAAQIVTGIGFVGAGLIFVKGDRVTGLTTAVTVWLVTGVGMACGAGYLYSRRQ